jgi:hypothetical protein
VTGIFAISLGWWPLHLLLLAVGFGVGAYGTIIGPGFMAASQYQRVTANV